MVISDYIGIPFNWNGDSIEEGFNCYTFFSYIQHKHFDRKMKKIRIPNTPRTITKEFSNKKNSINWKHTNTPKHSDAVFMTYGQQLLHLGIYIDINENKGILHCQEKIGVIFSNIHSLKRNFLTIKKILSYEN